MSVPFCSGAHEPVLIMRNDLLIYHIDRSSIKKALEIRDRDIQNPLSGSLRRPGNMGSDDGVTGIIP